MPNDPSFITTVRALIQQNDFSEAIEQLHSIEADMPASFASELTNQAGMYQLVQRDNLAGILPYEQYLLQTNKVRIALLGLLEQVALRKVADVLNGAPDRPAGPPSPAVAAVPKFVIVYDPADKNHAQLLNKHLNVLKFTKRIAVYDVHADAGASDDPVARAHAELANADYLLCLVSINLTSSPDWFGFTLEALENRRRVIPLRVENADIEGTGLDKIKGLPTMNRAVNDFAQPDVAYKDIVDELKKLLPKNN